MLISDYISPESLVARSVNIERDMGDKNTLSQYFLTAKGTEIIYRLIAGLNGSKISAWSLTGPYGMGKSSFVNYLLALVGPKSRAETKLAREMLREKDLSLYEKFQGVLSARRIVTRGFFRVAATSSFQSVNHSLVHGLNQSLNFYEKKQQGNKNNRKLCLEAEQLLSKDLIDTRHMVDLFNKATNEFKAPAVVVIDEFGKNLEYMARNPGKGDLYSLQALAETNDIFLWVCLHQSFEEYAVGFSSSQLQEWGKIQGRFEDISFIEPRAQMVEFIRKALLRKKMSPPVERKIKKWATVYHNAVKKLGLTDTESLSIEYLKGFYPLHPLAALILPELCVQYAQNDRTLFAFLCGGEPNALPAFLSSKTIPPKDDNLVTLGLDQLYDYFISSIKTISSSRPGSSRWLEINNLVESTKRLPENEYKIIKSIGLLNLLSGHNGYRASEKIIAYTQVEPSNVGEKQIVAHKDILDSLVEKGILIYREYADEYRLWEGTDFDITSAMNEQRDRLSHKPLVSLLNKISVLIPSVASKHSYKTGTLRHFDRRWADISTVNDLKVFDRTAYESYGTILYCFGKDEVDDEKMCKATKARPLIVAYARSEEQIRETVINTAAAQAILSEYSELERDGIARKEAKHRAKATEDRLRNYLSDLYKPGNLDVSWYADGQEHNLKSYRELSSLISKLCDKFYNKCPVIKNELINRNKLTGAAAMARRKLMAAMLNAEDKENLSFEGTGPEVAIYRTMLNETRLHFKDSNDQWSFVAPKNKHAESFKGVWDKFEEIFHSIEEESISVSDIISELTRPPFGMKMGPIPVLICYYLAVKSEELALYYHESFVPILGSEEMEMMTKRPEFFNLRRFEPTGVRKSLFQFYRRILNTQSISGDVKLRNISMVGVVGPMAQFANSLTSYARQTCTIGKYAQNVRNTLLISKEPIQLLFVDLPNAVGLERFDKDSTPDSKDEILFESRLQDAFKELINADDMLLKEIQETMMNAFENNNDPGSFRAEITKDAIQFHTPCRDIELKSVLTAMSKTEVTDDEWFASIASAVMTRPVKAWRDSDMDEFPVAIRDIADRFKAFSALVKSQIGFSESKNKNVRLVSYIQPDGQQFKKIIEVDKKISKRAEHLLSEIKKNHKTNEIEALLLLLSEELIKSEN